MIVRVRPGETRIALCDAGRCLVDFALDRETSTQDLVGDVVLGRVKKIVPALQAAFVDIGTQRDGFLGLAEARPRPHSGGVAPHDNISDYVCEGEALMVQVMAEARDDKGAKLTRRVNVAGALCVLTPNDPGVRISKRVRGEEPRNRLREAVSAALEDGQGCVVRSAALEVSDDALRQDIGALQARWGEWQAHAASARPPERISASPMAALRFLDENGYGKIGKIVIDDPVYAKNLERALKGHLLAVELHAEPQDVFERFAIAEAVAALCDPRVTLPSGGSIIIEHTAALTAIDVNAGAAGQGRRGADLALATNLEAVHEAARQMRLRNLCGLIVIDVMPMRAKGVTGRVVAALKDALADDPAGPYVLGTTKGGLLEVTRPRRRAPLNQQLLARCPTCAGSAMVEAPLTVGLRALERVLAEVRAAPALIPVLSAPSVVIMVLRDEAPAALKTMNDKLGHALELVVDETLGDNCFEVKPKKGGG